MLQKDWIIYEKKSQNLWFFAFLLAFITESIILSIVGWNGHWLAHPQKTHGFDSSQFIETEMVSIPEKAKLFSKTPQIKKAVPEAVISKIPHQGKETSNSHALETENKTEVGSQITASHGPVAVYAPSPVIPSYLQDQEIHAHVVIDFYVTAQGAVTPRLIGSSGNEELDAIALKTAHQWQFRPAEENNKPVSAKVRLRILFEVI